MSLEVLLASDVEDTGIDGEEVTKVGIGREVGVRIPSNPDMFKRGIDKALSM